MGKKACEKCRLACSLLHSSIGTTSAQHTSSKRNELKTLDAKISSMQELLSDVTQMLSQMKQELNRQNDGFLHRFPLEIIAQIFAEFEQMSDLHYVKSGFAKRHQWMPVLILGGVCRSWRGTTLAIPQLWAKLTMNPSKDALPEWLVMAAEWLDRSRGFPLSLTIKEPGDSGKRNDRPFFPACAPSDLIQLIRSHSRRWKRLVVESTSEIIHELLDGLENLPPTGMDLLSVHGPSHRTVELVVADYLRPKELSFRHVLVLRMPSSWSRLTSFKAQDILIDQVHHILKNAVNLEHCSVIDVFSHRDREFTEIVHDSLTSLVANISDSDANILCYLTLPSLKTFNYRSGDLGFRPNRRLRELTTEILYDFIDRCGVSPEFILEVLEEDSKDWHNKVQCITVLEYSCDQWQATKLLKALASRQKPLLFPDLRQLHLSLSMSDTSKIFWSSICDLYQGASTQRRPLESLSIILDGRQWDASPYHGKPINKETYRRICAIQKLGKKISVADFDGNDDVLGSYARLSGWNNTVDEHAEDNNGDDQDDENGDGSENDDEEQDENDMSDDSEYDDSDDGRYLVENRIFPL